MEVIPEIQILDGRAVHLTRGRHDTALDLGTPQALAEKYAAAGATRLHVVDLSGALAGHPVHLLQVVRDLGTLLPVQFGGGLRTPADISLALDLGVDRLVLGTAAVLRPQLLELVPRERLVVALDVWEGKLLIEGHTGAIQQRPADFAARLASQGVERILAKTIGREGTGLGPDLHALAAISTCGAFVLAAGGIGSVADVERVFQLPAIEGVVIGKALHHGAFTVAEAARAGLVAC